MPRSSFLDALAQRREPRSAPRSGGITALFSQLPIDVAEEVVLRPHVGAIAARSIPALPAARTDAAQRSRRPEPRPPRRQRRRAARSRATKSTPAARAAGTCGRRAGRRSVE
jgi:hypothetical protein